MSDHQLLNKRPVPRCYCWQPYYNKQWTCVCTNILHSRGIANSSWKAYSSSASEEISLIFGTRRFIAAFTTARHLSLPPVTSVQSTTSPHSISSKIHFNIFLPCRSSQMVSFLQVFPPYCLWIDHVDGVWWVQIMKLLTAYSRVISDHHEVRQINYRFRQRVLSWEVRVHR